MLVICTVLLASAVLAALAVMEDEVEERLRPGHWRISTDGEIFSLSANEAPVEDLFLAIQNLASGKVRAEKVGEGRVSARYYNVPLDELLSRLGIEYVLVYQRGAHDGYELESGWVSYDDRPRTGSTPSPGTDILTAGPGTGKVTLSQDAQRRLAEAGVPRGPSRDKARRCPRAIH